MAVAIPRHATFLPGCVVPLFSEARAPPKNAFAAVAANTTPDTGFLPDLSSPAFSTFFRESSQRALAPAAFAAVPLLRLSRLSASRLSLIDGFPTTSCPFLFLININKTPAPKSDACTDVRCARSRNLAVPCHASSFALRVPR